jgi:hypothetical protein
MIYVEYIERDRFLPFDIFRHLGDQSAWTDPEDKLVGSFGRTMRLGPMPSYLAFWECSGMARMDEWEAHFLSPAAQHDRAERATHAAIHLQRGGCYDVVQRGPKVDRGQLYAIDYFAAGPEVQDAALKKRFTQRAKAQKTATLNFVLRRIGMLGPPPGCMAVWSFADYVALEPFERARGGADFMPSEVGVYRWFGKEIL